MDFNFNLSPIQDRKISSALSRADRSPPQSRKETFTEELRQTIDLTEKRVKTAAQRKISAPELGTLTQQSQELILHAFETIKNEDSKSIVAALDESRFLLRSSLEEFQRGQDEYKQQLEQIKNYRELGTTRRKENAIPISLFLQQKRDIQGLADLRPNSGMNTTYQAYFEALLTHDANQQQHPSDKGAVIKYIRRRERRKRAETNRKNNELSSDILQKQTVELIGKMGGIDIKFEHERQRQNDLIRTNMNERKLRAQNVTETSEIIDRAHEATLARERVEQKQREKIEAHLSAKREQLNRTPTNVIHVQSRVNNDDDDANENNQLNDEQKEETKTSIQLLNTHNDAEESKRPRTPVYGGETSNEKIANIYI
ncbi:unnamed protein product [Rotaria magnacalcarata]|uniref:Uncharacterized protein n=2 Tax=Rotaria magnacalcarata TaxID=392030 RepID=A0A816XZC4_9BILA|nr:unnamed protein product [Rotaria magnacalcarata]CAF2088688.1 unnamed protein product [Rotaria magnacalcarata]CAF2154209.1 unnamed protein product [Rotaria magnacalcarata]CAF3962030.1 unnamed protein product [Rotaria magnacalcarata]CAF4012071.1 unnamed protein product [Rotaria magnacalcarata]